jgi:hypothetical protein
MDKLETKLMCDQVESDEVRDKKKEKEKELNELIQQYNPLRDNTIIHS